MPPVCKVCVHPKRKEIDAMLLDGDSSLRDVSTKFGIAVQTLQRHRVNHQGWQVTSDYADRMAKEAKKREQMAAPSRVAYLESKLPSKEELGDVLTNCIERLDTIVNRCEESGADALALSGLDGIRKQVADLARLAGHVGTPAQTNLQIGVQVNLSASDIASALAAQLQSVSRSDAATVLELTADE